MTTKKDLLKHAIKNAELNLSILVAGLNREELKELRKEARKGRKAKKQIEDKDND